MNERTENCEHAAGCPSAGMGCGCTTGSVDGEVASMGWGWALLALVLVLTAAVAVRVFAGSEQAPQADATPAMETPGT